MPAQAAVREPAPDAAESSPEARRAAVEAAVQSGREEGFRLGYEEGRRQGYEEGLTRAAVAMKEAEARMEEVVAAREALSATLAEERARLLDAVREDIARLAEAVARRVLERELTQSHEVVLGLVADLLDEIRGQDAVVRAHPEDAAALEGADGPALGNRGSGGRVQVVADPAISRGGVLIETPGGGTWDARLETRLQAAEAALEEGLGLTCPEEDLQG